MSENFAIPKHDLCTVDKIDSLTEHYTYSLGGRIVLTTKVTYFTDEKLEVESVEHDYGDPV